MIVYNEIDPFAAEWLRNLIAAGHIADGVVNETPIEHLASADVAGPGQRHFFAGIGGWSAALRLAGVRDDADVWTGSCPCQPFSQAGKRRGARDPRHLWPTWFALIEQHRPAIIFGEQVASRDGLAWLDLVFSDLERCGYTVGAADLCAAGVGAPHIRQRLYFVAGDMANADDARPQGRRKRRNRANQRAAGAGGMAGAVAGSWSDAEWIRCTDGKTRPAQPGAFPLADGVPGRVGRLRAYGNAIVPQVAAAFVTAALDAIGYAP